MQPPRLAGLLIAVLPMCFALGCSGPTYTAGTRGLAAKDLSVLSITQLPADAHIQIDSVQFDGKGDAYKIGKTSRDFYLTPGDHTASFTLSAQIPKPEGMGALGSLATWMIPKNSMTIPSPGEIPLGAVAAGKSYELGPNTAGGADVFEKMLQEGKLSLVHEKSK